MLTNANGSTENRGTLERETTAALKKVSRNQSYKAHVMRDPILHAALLRGVHRYIGGETRGECLQRAAELQAQDFLTIIDYVGETIADAKNVEQIVVEFEALIDAVAASPSGRAISPDLSHIGLAISSELALKNAARLAKRAKAAGVEVMLNMEESTRTQAILDTHRQLCEEFNNVGITLQAYLYRTDKDLQEALRRPGRTRLVKGAYQELASIARPLGPEVDRAYAEFLKVILDQNHPCYIATHDQQLLDQAHQWILERGARPRKAEFELNYGIRPDRAARMRELGYPVRIYLPYGNEWFLYLCHRIAEYPPNLYQALIDVIDGPPTASLR
jgi:proline dehydrogenase